MNSTDSLIQTLLKAHRDVSDCPPPERVTAFFDDLMGLLFPEFARTRHTNKAKLKKRVEMCRKEIREVFSLHDACLNAGTSSTEVISQFFDELLQIRQLLLLDVDAMYMGDPAAKSRAEVIRTYPGFYAIAAHRIAHKLLVLGVHLIPRIISEYAHRQTGIDIHPGAQIGDHFCIDHGTGIVIGETAIIGSNVKIYQGVTLGGLSVRKEDARQKRHPTIGDQVVLYAGASILGGSTVIGANSIIGGNVWLTDSVPPSSKVYYQAKMTNSNGESDTITFK